MMKDYQTYEGTSNGDGYGDGRGDGDGSGDGGGYGDGRGGGNGYDYGYDNLLCLFPIPDKYHYLLDDQTPPQRVKICYDLHNASNQEEIDILVEWYEAVQIDKAT